MPSASNAIEIDIFRAGTRTANNGATFTFSKSDLQQAVETFNPRIFRPPLIVSHDTQGQKDEALAHTELCYGIPKYLKLVGNTLKAGFDKIAPQMVNWVRSGMLHSVSSSFYLPNSPNNPYPGKLSLRHIAALGATPPAVKGLTALEFAVPEFNVFNEEGVVSFCMQNSSWAIAADLFQRFREYLIEKDSLEVADRVLPAEQIAQLRSMGDNESMLQQQVYEMRSRIAEMEEEQATPNYGEMDYKKLMKTAKMTTYDVAEALSLDEADVEAIASEDKVPTEKEKKALADLLMNTTADMSEELQRREEALRRREVEFEEKEIASFVDSAIRAGKLVSSKRDRTIKTLLAASNTPVAEFSEDGQENSLRQVLMDEIDSADAWNYNQEIVTPLSNVATSLNFSAPTGYGIDKGSNNAYKRAIAFCESNKLNPNDANDWQQALEATQGVTNGQ